MRHGVSTRSTLLLNWWGLKSGQSLQMGPGGSSGLAATKTAPTVVSRPQARRPPTTRTATASRLPSTKRLSLLLLNTWTSVGTGGTYPPLASWQATLIARGAISVQAIRRRSAEASADMPAYGTTPPATSPRTTL